MSVVSALGLTETIGSLVGAGTGAALGAGKAALDAGQESKMRKLSADQMKWSPWTGMASETVRAADPGASILGGLGAGLASAQGAERASADEKYRKDLLNILKAKGPASAKWGAAGDIGLF